MQHKYTSIYIIEIIIILIIELMLRENFVSAKIRIVTPKWQFKCENGPGAFPHESDCQRWWLCQKTLQNMYEIDDQLKVSFNFGMVPHLYKCPNGYNFDTTSRRCRKKDIAKCGINQSTK